MLVAAVGAMVATPVWAYDYGDNRSVTLIGKAWAALSQNDIEAVLAYTNKCLELYGDKAKEMQASLKDFPTGTNNEIHSFWALNDCATGLFIQGEAYRKAGMKDKAKEAYERLVKDFSFGQCWDPKGWFWKVAQGSSDQLATIGTSYDFGDYTSQTLTVKAWEVLGTNDHKGVELYTKKCIELYEAEAIKQQASLTEFAPKEKAFDYWALNDVSTCYFILGESLMAQKRYKEAKAAFDRVVNDLSFAQCWDPKGWFWKVAVGARGRLNKILAEGGS